MKKGRMERRNLRKQETLLRCVNVYTCNKFLNYAPERGETGSVSKFK